ncbi:MAG: ABC transporter permease [Bacteroidota bacterium]
MDSPITPPPRLWTRLFRWFCRPELVEDIEGDLHERFQLHLQRQGRANAHWRFIHEVLLLFRPGIVRPLFKTRSNSYAMLRFNLKIALRNIRRYQRTFLINLIGLSSGLASVLFIYLWVQDERKVDQGFTHGDRLYQVMQYTEQPDGVHTNEWLPLPLRDYLREEVPQLETIAMSSGVWEEMLLDANGTKVKVSGQMVEPTFFTLLDYPFLAGDPAKALTQRGEIVLSESLAKTLFPGLYRPEEALGMPLRWELDGWQDMVVTGIMKDNKGAYSEDFQFAVSFDHYIDNQGRHLTNWWNGAPLCYARLREGVSIGHVNELLRPVMEKHTEDASHWLGMVAYPSLYLQGLFVNGVQTGGRITYVRLFSFVALFIMILACINFMNLATARASRRVKEVGVRKTMGAGRATLIVQQITESLLIAAISMGLAVLLVGLLMPEFNRITQKQLLLTANWELWRGVLGATLLAGLLAGSYPALYLSKFQPIKVLKGSQSQSTGDAWARKGLVVFQFAVSILLLVAVTVIYRQVQYTRDMHLGYNQDFLLRIDVDGALHQELGVFLDEANRLPGVLSASSTSSSMMETGPSTTFLNWEGKDPDDRTPFQMSWIDYRLFETMELDFVAGRGFDVARPADSTALIFNEKAIELMGEAYADPIGKTITWGEEYEIVGVVKNYHFETVHEEIKPAVYFSFPNAGTFILARIDPEQAVSAIADLEELYHKINPEYTFVYDFVDEAFEQQYRTEQQVAELSLVFAILAGLISCLGLVGLVAFTTDRRRKEIGVRKVLGGEIWQILVLINREFTLLVGAALIIALPTGYLLAERWLANYAFHTQLPWALFLGIGLLALGVTWAVVGMQSLRAARMNPVHALQDE